MAQVAISLGVSLGVGLISGLLSPKQKQTPVDKDKYDDIRIQGSGYGVFIPRFWGKARFAPQIVFTDGIKHYVISSGGGGGKGGHGGGGTSTPTNTHVYTTTVDLLFGRGGKGAIVRFLRIWADTDLVIDNSGPTTGGNQTVYEAENAALAGGAYAVADDTASNGFFVTNLGFGRKVTFNSISLAPVEPGDPGDPVEKTRISFYYKATSDLTVKIYSNGFLYTPRFPNTNDQWSIYTLTVNGHSELIEYGNDGATAPDLDYIGVYKFYAYPNFSADLQYRVTGILNPNITYPSNLDDPSEYYNYKPQPLANGQTNLTTVVPSQQIRFYTGTANQTADSSTVNYLEQRFGAGEGVKRAAAYRGYAHVVLQDYTLRGGRLANFTIEGDAGTHSAADIAATLCQDVGLLAADYDFSRITTFTQIGFLEYQSNSRKSLLEQLSRYHSFRSAEIGTQIVALPEGADSLAAINNNDLKAHLAGGEYPDKFAQIVIKEEQLMPREVRVSIMNPAKDYHNDPQTAQIFASPAATETKEYTFQIVDTAANAKIKAEILGFKEFAENKSYELSVMPNLAKYSQGDVVTLNLSGTAPQDVRIERKTIPLPIGPIKWNAVSTEKEVYRQPVAAVTQTSNLAQAQLASTSFPRNSIVVPIISAPITERERGKLGVYLAVSGRGRGDWQNCGVYRELSGDDYQVQFLVDAPSPVGVCQTTLANFTGTGEDGTNALNIYFFDDIELESVAAADLDKFQNLNLVRVGAEWMQFRTAAALTLPDNSTYRSGWRISNLRRGLFGTTAAGAGHAGGESASVVTPALRFYELNKQDVGTTVKLKAVTNGQAVEVAPVTSFVFNPLSAYQLYNVTPTRVFDAANTTENQIAQLLATVIEDANL